MFRKIVVIFFNGFIYYQYFYLFSEPKDKEEKIDLPGPTIRYAFLDCDVYEEVYVSCVVSPDQLYVQRAKFVDW